MKKQLFLLLCILSLNACEHWPAPSTGGYADTYLYTKFYQSKISRHSLLCRSSERLAALSHQLEALQKTQAKRCYPARFTQLELLERQIAQEIAAGLFLSVSCNLNLFEQNLIAIRALNQTKKCSKPLFNQSWDRLISRTR